MAVARNLWGYIDRRDHRLMLRMNRWRAPRWIRIWMIAATRMGDGWRGRHRSGCGDFCFQGAEEIEPTAEAMPD